MTNLLNTALAWHQAGGCVLPAASDGTKRPALKTWQAYQQVRPPADQIDVWLSTNLYDGIGIVCGQTSGNLEMLELEGRAVAEGAIERLTDVVTAAGIGDLWASVATDGYVEKTPSGGLHILYRVTDEAVPGNLKLARRPATADELVEKPGEKLKVLAETRGEGGWVVIAPSNGRTHPTGEPWEVIAGGPATVPTITAAQRHLLHQAFRTLDQVPAVEPVAERPRLSVVRPDGDVSPGDDFEAQTDWTDPLLLGGAGWTVLTSHAGGYRTWKRPGKDTPGISATTGRADDRDRLYVFSSATEFEQEHPYTKFGAYALLHHAGDYSAAARELRRLGYGTPTPDASEAQQAAIHDLIPRTNGSSALAVDPQLGANPIDYYGATEDGIARALVAHHGDELRFCPQRGKWLHWTGNRWTWDDAETCRELIRAMARSLPSDETWRSFKKRAMSANGVAGIERLARSDARITVPIDQLDARPYELNTPAGIVDLRTGTIRPPDPKALHTRCTAVAPDFERASPIFLAFLEQTFGNLELAAYVQRLMGISIIGTVLEQLLPFAHGIGANGKSTLLEAAMHVLGFGETGYAMAAPADMLMVRRHTEHPAELAQLVGARLVVCSELEDGQRFAEARIKQLTGRDSINARFMRRDPFTFIPSHTMWLLGNHMPTAQAGGPAFWRRVKLLPFTRVVPEGERDARLGEKLAEHGGAVLAWMIRGAADYHTAGMREPAIVRDATAAYEADQDTVKQFVEEACHVAAGQTQIRVSTADARRAYETWCHDIGVDPVNPKRFGMELRAHWSVKPEKLNGVRFYTGITLLVSDPGQSDPEDDRDRGRYR